jgi:hypothetical protein
MTDIQPIHELMALAMNDVRAVGKDGRFSGGGAGSFSFRGIDAVMNAVGPVFRKWGIVGPVPTLEELIQDQVLTGKEKRSTNRSTVKVRFTFYGPSGDHVDCVTPGEGFDFGDKATAKAMSVACRTALLQTLCLPTDEPDPDNETYEQAPEDPLEVARQTLVDTMQRLGLKPPEVLARYAQDNDGLDPRTDTDVVRITEFTKGLGK